MTGRGERRRRRDDERDGGEAWRRQGRVEEIKGKRESEGKERKGKSERGEEETGGGMMKEWRRSE